MVRKGVTLRLMEVSDELMGSSRKKPGVANVKVRPDQAGRNFFESTGSPEGMISALGFLPCGGPPGVHDESMV
jgi:hypothetical protein